MSVYHSDPKNEDCREKNDVNGNPRWVVMMAFHSITFRQIAGCLVGCGAFMSLPKVAAVVAIRATAMRSRGRCPLSVERTFFGQNDNRRVKPNERFESDRIQAV